MRRRDGVLKPGDAQPGRGEGVPRGRPGPYASLRGQRGSGSCESGAPLRSVVKGGRRGVKKKQGAMVPLVLPPADAARLLPGRRHEAAAAAEPPDREDC